MTGTEEQMNDTLTEAGIQSRLSQLGQLRGAIAQAIVGQEDVVEQLLIGAPRERRLHAVALAVSRSTARQVSPIRGVNDVSLFRFEVPGHVGRAGQADDAVREIDPLVVHSHFVVLVLLDGDRRVPR